ncbi:hypothetical protein TCAL_13865 [Tigriopus californicus]|uniref:Sulfatase N-terminal domain-containing protein n=1 Tax=Tigriopus californicus TaxID=6832 RepID=A0A553N6S9_TIGCA|nr:iduronate 2-sulfatase-like [Tigriopus californicus]TRY61138.1 hypothetical protein TCAL_13865 [Tigriopus californicus]|eukprot:TCALIF_13865-PA protein Name:"Similar to Ids Iduronate 2-sulfatase (Mus musculus)" AED:0.02 eAED:0.03 QI:0/-1/0/1/-1/1/1/0/554
MRYQIFSLWVILCFASGLMSVLIYYHATKLEPLFQTRGPKNVIFIIFDDLRPALGVYGDSQALTPNIDQLGAKSVVFSSAYTQQAICGPSRTSLLTSRRPDRTKTYANNFNWRSVRDFVTLPQYFKQNGYHAQAFGKIFHNQVNASFNDMPFSWSAEPYRPITGLLLKKFKTAPVCEGTEESGFNIICPLDREVNAIPLPDTQVRRRASEFLTAWTKLGSPKPLFLGVGFTLPHIPFKIPNWVTNFHPIENIALANNSFPGENAPTLARNGWKALFTGAGDWPTPDKVSHYLKQLKQFYYSSITFVDQKVGKFLETVVELGLADNTIICLVADHGWHLGEHGLFAKNTNYEEATRVPWMVYDPRLQSLNGFSLIDIVNYKNLPHNLLKRRKLQPGRFVNGPVELLDVYPTLVDLARLPRVPKCPTTLQHANRFCLEGVSRAASILQNQPIPSEAVAISQYPRPGNETDGHLVRAPSHMDIRVMGYALRSRTHRFVAWFEFDPNSLKTNFNRVIAQELYDEMVDPQENINIAYGPESCGIAKDYLRLLREKLEPA